MPKPTFVFIGPGRSGSTWMYEILRSHSEVCLAEGTKETLFFNEEYNKGVNWYESFFSECNNSKAIGELSNTYIYDSVVPKRMKSVIPNVTLLSCLRDPIDRIQSVYFYYRRNGRMKKGFKESIKNNSFMVNQNKYWSHLKEYLKYFNESQIKVLFYEDLNDNPNKFATRLCRSIGVNSNKLDREKVEKKINVGSEARNWMIGKVSSFFANVLRNTGNHEALDYLKRNDVVRSIILRRLSSEEKNVIDKSTKKQLLDEYESEIQGIERFTGRNLNYWRDV